MGRVLLALVRTARPLVRMMSLNKESVLWIIQNVRLF